MLDERRARAMNHRFMAQPPDIFCVILRRREKENENRKSPGAVCAGVFQSVDSGKCTAGCLYAIGMA